MGRFWPRRRQWSAADLFNGLWLLAVALLPLTSLPILSRLMFSSMVAPPSVVLLGLLALLWLLPAWLRGTQAPRESIALVCFVVVLWLTWLLSFFYATPSWRAASPLLEGIQAWLTVLSALCVYWVTAGWIAAHEDRLSLTLRVLNWSGLLMLVWSAFQAYFVLRYQSQYPVWMYDIQHLFSSTEVSLFPRRITGMAFEPSWLGHQLVMLYLPYWLSATVSGLSAHRRLGRLSLENLLLLGGLAALFLSFSRVAWISFLLMLSLLMLKANLWLGQRLHRAFFSRIHLPERQQAWVKGVLWLPLLLLFVAAYLGLIFMLVLVGSQLDPRFGLLLEDRLFSANNFLELTNMLMFGERAVYWSAGWEVFQHSPWVGVGLGNVGFYFPKMMPNYGWMLTEIRNLLIAQDVIPNTKSLWLRLLAESGLLGFSAFLVWGWLLALAALLVRRLGSPQLRLLGLWGQFVLLGFLSEGFSIDSFALPYVWFSLGLLSAAAMLTRQKLAQQNVLKAHATPAASLPGVRL